jgi:hypothetical protein
MRFGDDNSFQTGAPPTQGRARAQSQLIATEKLQHAMVVALVPNAEFTIKMWIKMSLPERISVSPQGGPAEIRDDTPPAWNFC